MISRVTQSMRAFAHVAFALAVFAALFASVAFARTAPNVPGAVPLDPSGHRPALAGALSAVPENTTAVVPVPLPAGAEPVDSTWYDLQDMGSLGHRIELGTDGRVHVTWQDEFCELGGGCPPNLSAPQPHPNRGMGYAVRDVNGVWSNLGKITDPRLPVCCIRDLVGGFAGRDLLEILEDRTGARATIVTSQLPPGKWHDYVADPTLADAICDRLLHPAHRIALKGSLSEKGGQPRLMT